MMIPLESISNAHRGNGIRGKRGLRAKPGFLFLDRAEQRKTRVLICRGALRTHCPSFVALALQGFAESKPPKRLTVAQRGGRTAEKIAQRPRCSAICDTYVCVCCGYVLFVCVYVYVMFVCCVNFC